MEYKFDVLHTDDFSYFLAIVVCELWLNEQNEQNERNEPNVFLFLFPPPLSPLPPRSFPPFFLKKKKRYDVWQDVYVVLCELHDYCFVSCVVGVWQNFRQEWAVV